MRNDARPIGEDAGRQSPVPSHPANETSSDSGDRVTHDRQSHVVNRPTRETGRRKGTKRDPVMPAGDSTLNTKI